MDTPSLKFGNIGIVYGKYLTNSRWLLLYCTLLIDMSKSTRNTAFRKVDVDQYEEEKYEEEVMTDDGVTGPNDAEVQSMLNKYPLTVM